MQGGPRIWQVKYLQKGVFNFFGFVKLPVSQEITQAFVFQMKCPNFIFPVRFVKRKQSEFRKNCENFHRNFVKKFEKSEDKRGIGLIEQKYLKFFDRNC